jgi:hypothetical protein
MVDTIERPDVRVFQTIGPAAPTIVRPLLEPVMIGPCFQIVAQGDAGSYLGAMKTFAYPGLKLGAVVDPAQVSVFLQEGSDLYDITAELPGGSILVGGVTIPASFIPSKVVSPQRQVSPVAGTLFTDANATFIASGVRAGDVLTFVTNPLNLIDPDSNVSLQGGNFTVLNVLSDTQLVLDPALTQETKVEYLITRFGIAAGEVLISFVARRLDGVETFFEMQGLDDIVAQLGPAVPANPLSFACSIAALHTDTIIAATMVASDDLPGYQQAFEFLESKEVWGMVALTNDVTVLEALQQHVDLLSQPQQKKERCALTNHLIPADTVYQLASVTGATTHLSDVFTDVNAKFVTNGVPVGALIVFATPQSFQSQMVSSVPIKAVLSETQVQLIAQADNTTAAIHYDVESPQYTKLQQAVNLQGLARAFKDRRFILVEPDIATVTENSAPLDVPGYYLAAAVAGLSAGSNPAQGFTNFPFAGFVGLKHSNFYFNETQMQAIDAGGVFMFVQDTLGAPVTPRHQLTSDMTSIKTQEFSILKATDFVAKFIRTNIRKLIGINNVTQDFIDNVLKPQSQALIKSLVDDRIIGKNTKITNIAQDPVFKDTINVDISQDTLFPVNFINYTIAI